MSRAQRRALVERETRTLPIAQQCRLLAVSRASVYRKPAEVSAEDLVIMALIDRQYLVRPYYGSRRMAVWLATQGHVVNRKRVRRLMRLLGLVAIYQRPNTSKSAEAHKIYPYLLGGMAIERVNQVWCADVTYIPMPKGFLYLVVIMDWVSCAVLAWRLSNTLGPDFCVEALEEALARDGRPEILNTDQGGQFTSDDFTGTPQRHGITISMDGKGRCMDNIFVERLWRSLKYEEVYLNAYATVAEAKAGIGAWLTQSALTKASVTARRARFTRKACGYVDDRLRRPAALPPLPKRAWKAGKCSPSPTYPLRQEKSWKGEWKCSLKPFEAAQRVRLPPGRGAARQPEASLAWATVTSLVKRRQRKLKPCVSLEIGYPLRPSVLGSRGRHRHDRQRRGRVGSAGVVEQGKGLGRVAREPVRSRVRPRVQYAG